MSFTAFVVAVVSGMVAGQINRAIYRWAWNVRAISPWSAPPPGVPARTWRDCIPVLGWWRLRRESPVHGAGFWIRPALIEVSCIFGSVAVYCFEMAGGLLPIGAIAPDVSTLQMQAVRHLVLLALMLIATFIDIDEKTIPDEVTIPGTWLGLGTAVLWPHSLLPAWSTLSPPIAIESLRLTSPAGWDTKWDGPLGIAVALLSIVAWWYALLPKTLWYRGGVRKFWRYLVSSILRHRMTYWLTGMAFVAAVLTSWIWYLGGDRWAALLTAWVGFCVGGGIVWSVRIIGSVSLRQEAMGFGDVTLLAMIGSFLGWQPTVLIFFLAPFTGVLIAVVQWLMTGRKDIAFGPFLCSATLIVLLAWPVAWSEWAYPLLQLGPLLLPVLGISAVTLGGTLFCWRRISSRYFGTST